MKKIVLLLIVIFFAACKSEKVNPNEIIITSKKDIFTEKYVKQPQEYYIDLE